MLPKLDLTQPIAIDTETFGLYPWQGDSPFAISLCDSKGTTAYWESNNIDPFLRTCEYDTEIFEYVRNIMSNPACTVVMHNAKFDCRMLELYLGIKLKAKLHETAIMARIAVSNELNVGLKPLSKKYLSIPDDDEKELKKEVMTCRRQAKKLGYNIGEKVEQDYWLPKYLDKDNTICETYATVDAERTILLYYFYDEILRDEGSYEIYEKEMQLWPIVYRMETRGAAISEKIVKEELAYNLKKADLALKDLYAQARGEFNPNSPDQLQEILYNVLKLPVSRYTPGGQPSTDWKALRTHFGHPFVRALMDYRASSKGARDFFQKFLDLSLNDHITGDPNVKVIHANFRQATTVTGRFSCSDPNLQQIQSKENNTGAEAPKARKPFIPRPGYELILADYSQLQLRIFADFSKEPTMMQAIANGRDIHDETTQRAWGGKGNPAAIDSAIVSLELRSKHITVDPLLKETWDKLNFNPKSMLGLNTYTDRALEEFADRWLSWFDYRIIDAEKSIGKSTSRKRGKNINFGKIFGAEAHAVQDLLFVDEQTARKFLKEYDIAFPAMKRYMQEAVKEALAVGHVYTVYGRKLLIDPETAYTTAVNYRVQGSEADLVKDAMIRVDAYLRRCRSRHKAYLTMQVHDELCIESEVGTPKWMLRGIKTIMEDHGGRFSIPMPVEVSISRRSWEEKEKVCL